MANHRFGERVEGHHVIPHKMEDSITVESCVVIRRSCHISVQQGGAWRDVSIYEDIETLPMPTRIMRIPALYPFYRG
ncbi:hypothetical protein [Azospirillum sp. SYSU D00513]|uniref:hypothetical protein n=1 Tax=Azospirillum sp. SYSU D00513 TaxID=2812561 RepID=UPI001A95EEAB|nr:hypothetical protein [Azospirillum sp. SYSU D00513]